MSGVHKTVAELERAAILRQAGYSLASIVEKTGISAATLARHFKRHKVAKGTLNDEAIAEARQQLLSDGGLIDQLKHEIAATIVDDISQFKLLRAAIAANLEELENDASLPAHYRSRGLAALSTSLRLSQELARKALRIDEMQPEAGELPELTVRELTQDEVEQLRHEQSKDSIFDPPETTDPDDNTVIEYGE
jgi:AcrR family transcriptional regulator